MDREQARTRALELVDRWERHPEERAAQIEALQGQDAAPIEMVGLLDHPSAGSYLADIAGGSATKDLKKAARRGLHRLRASGHEAPRLPVSEHHPILRKIETRIATAHVSVSDGIGSRWLVLFVERSTGGGYSLGLIINEIVGIKTCLVDETTRRRHADHVRELSEDTGFTFYEIPTDYGRALLAEALERNAATNFSLPTEFQTHRGILGDIGGPPETALIYDFVSQAEIRLEPEYLAESAELAEEPEVKHWYFDFYDVRPFAEKLRQADQSLLVLHQQSRQERVERIEIDAIQTIMTEETRRGMRRRLEEFAYVLWITGRESAAKLAVAAAIGLEQPLVTRSLIARITEGPAQEHHPFILELLRMSLDMADEIELSGMAASIPHRTPYTRLDD